MSASDSRLDHNNAEGIVIQLKTRTGLINARVFVTDDNRSIGVVLYRDGKPIAAESFDAPTSRRLKTECLRWLASRQLDDRSRLDIIAELEENYTTLRRFRQHGEDTAQDWLGPASSRRLPQIDDAVM